MLKQFILAILLLVSAVAYSNGAASPFDDPCGTTYTIGPLTATGYDIDQRQARKEAYQDMADQVALIQDALPEPDIITAVIVNSASWNDPIYELEFTIVALITCD